jgi:hypothetical protein
MEVLPGAEAERIPEVAPDGVFEPELRSFRERLFSRGVTVLDYKGI